jgi:hypothetical protein
MMLLRLYPRVWRARYQSEIVDLIELETFSWSDVLDIGRGAMREQALALPARVLGVFFAGGSYEAQALAAFNFTEGVRFGVLGGLLALAAIPAAAWLDARGWTPPDLDGWGLLTLLAVPVFLRGLPIACLLVIGRKGGQAEAAAERLSVGRLELAAWAAFAFAVSLFVRAGDLQRSHQHADVLRSWGWVFMNGVVGLQLLGSATTGAVKRRRRLKELGVEHQRALRASVEPSSLS